MLPLITARREERAGAPMNPTYLVLNITSEDPDTLDAFYADVVGLPRDPASGGFQVGNALFVVDGHSETKGMAKEPHRCLFNFHVDDIEAEQARLEVQGVQAIRKLGREHWGGVFSTFVDPDGNYFQLMQFKPEQSQ